jgi:hypothetical protein
MKNFDHSKAKKNNNRAGNRKKNRAKKGFNTWIKARKRAGKKFAEGVM